MQPLRRSVPLLGVLVSALLGAEASSAAPQTFTVTSTADSGAGSLRAALEAANGNGNPSDTDTITFDIPGTGPHRILPSSPLPAATESVAIDATQEPDYAGAPVVVLDGSGAGTGAAGLEIHGDNGRVFGLSIVNFSGSGIFLPGSGNWIGFCWLGLDADESPAGNDTGILVYGDDNLIGTSSGFLLGQSRNVLSANSNSGVSVHGGSGNSIRNNLIGLAPTATTLVGNDFDGVTIYAASDNVVGGTGSDAGNFIAGNGAMGVLIRETASTGNRVLGNEIGFTESGATRANTVDGVRIYLGATGNEIGDVTSGAANRITTANGPGQDGVSIAGNGTRLNTVRGNAVVHASDQGIDLGDDGATPNDPGDADGDPNALQNFPTFPSPPTYASGPDELTVTYAVSSSDPANAAYPLTVDFYRADPDGKAGEAWLGEDVYDSSDYSSGAATATFTPGASVSAGGSGLSGPDEILATATDVNGNTSEFSATVTVPEASRELLAAGALATLGLLGARGRGRRGPQPVARSSRSSQRR